MLFSEVCDKDPEYAAYLMVTYSVGSATANNNLQSCQTYIDKNLDWKTIRRKQQEEKEARGREAMPKGTLIEFEGTCEYREVKYQRAASWLPQKQQDNMNFDCILIMCDNGLKLKVQK